MSGRAIVAVVALAPSLLLILTLAVAWALDGWHNRRHPLLPPAPTILTDGSTTDHGHCPWCCQCSGCRRDRQLLREVSR